MKSTLFLKLRETGPWSEGRLFLQATTYQNLPTSWVFLNFPLVLRWLEPDGADGARDTRQNERVCAVMYRQSYRWNRSLLFLVFWWQVVPVIAYFKFVSR